VDDLLTGRFPDGTDFVIEVETEGVITIPWPLQVVRSTGSYTSTTTSTPQQYNRAVPCVDFRWDVSNPMKYPAQDRIHDCGATLEDLEALFEHHKRDTVPVTYPRWPTTLYLGMYTPRDLKQQMDRPLGETSPAVPPRAREAITSFGKYASLVTETLAVQLPGRGFVNPAVSWDRLTEVALIGHSAMQRLCPWLATYATFQGSNLCETQPTDGTPMQWTSIGLVPVNIDGSHQLCKMLEDRHDLAEQSGLDMSIPTSVVRAMRHDLRLREPDNLARMFFGATLDDYSVHAQSGSQ